jgi:hypothetical protein
MCRMSQECPENASQYIKADILKCKAVTLSKYIGNLLRDCVKLHVMAGLNISCVWLGIWL